VGSIPTASTIFLPQLPRQLGQKNVWAMLALGIERWRLDREAPLVGLHGIGRRMLEEGAPLGVK